MVVIHHKMNNYSNDNNIELLFIGTFNPEVSCNSSTFFYGRPRNFFWQLLPFAIDKENLKSNDDSTKKAFLKVNKIGLIDIIASVKIEKEEELCDYSDIMLDKSSPIFNENIFKLIDNCPNLQSIFFTRKSFSRIPNIKKRFLEIKDYAEKKNINVNVIVTPSRHANATKQAIWNNLIGSVHNNI